MSNATTQPAPDGYTEEYDSSTWNVGHVFFWSAVYDCWLDCNVRLTVKPGVPVEDAFEARMDRPMWAGYAVFFNCSFVSVNSRVRAFTICSSR